MHGCVEYNIGRILIDQQSTVSKEEPRMSLLHDTQRSEGNLAQSYSGQVANG